MGSSEFFSSVRRPRYDKRLDLAWLGSVWLGLHSIHPTICREEEFSPATTSAAACMTSIDRSMKKRRREEMKRDDDDGDDADDATSACGIHVRSNERRKEERNGRMFACF